MRLLPLVVLGVLAWSTASAQLDDTRWQFYSRFRDRCVTRQLNDSEFLAAATANRFLVEDYCACLSQLVTDDFFHDERASALSAIDSQTMSPFVDELTELANEYLHACPFR